MPVPDFQTLMLPLLEALSDCQERLIPEVTASLADQFKLTDVERQEKLPSGQQTVIVASATESDLAYLFDVLTQRGCTRNPHLWKNQPSQT